MGIEKVVEIMENSVKNLQKNEHRIAIQSRYIYAIEYYAVLKKKEIISQATTWMN